MTKKVALALSFGIALLCMAASCAKAPGPEALAGPAGWTGKTVYTQVNIWPLKSTELHWVNYHLGGMLPINTPVTIEAISKKELEVKVSGGPKLRFANKQRHSKLNAYQWAGLHFAPTKRDLSGFSKDELAAIEQGEVKEGMSREAVIAAYGYPPAHRTPSLDNAQWTYWVSKRYRRTVIFGPDGTVQTVWDSRPPAPAPAR